MKTRKPKVFNYQDYIDVVEENKSLKKDIEDICAGVKDLQKQMRNLEIQNRILREELSKYV